MAKTPKDKEFEETKRIMERLVKMPHEPHKPLKKAAGKKAPAKKRSS